MNVKNEIVTFKQINVEGFETIFDETVRQEINKYYNGKRYLILNALKCM